MSRPPLRRREFVALLGSGAAWPLTARAREAAKVPTIGVLWHAGSPDEGQPFFGALRQGFKDLGDIEGQNIRLEHRFPNEVPDRFKSMVAELVALKVDVIVSAAPASYFVKGVAAETIPHVFMMVGDPVGLGLVESLARPGGNATGFSILSVDLTKKRLQFLHDAIPGLSSVGLLIGSGNPTLVAPGRAAIDEAQAAAAELGLTLQIFEAASVGELDRAFDAASRAGIQGLVIGANGLFYQGKVSSRNLRLRTACRHPCGQGNLWNLVRSYLMGPAWPRSFDVRRYTSTRYSREASPLTSP
jgi:putative ABC transport system substrate-binding protein